MQINKKSDTISIPLISEIFSISTSFVIPINLSQKPHHEHFSDGLFNHPAFSLQLQIVQFCRVDAGRNTSNTLKFNETSPLFGLRDVALTMENKRLLENLHLISISQSLVS
jgi:hypothetical protein